MYLTKAQEKDIVVRFNNGERNKTALAAEFGVSPRTIGRVLERASVKKTKALEIVKGFKTPTFVVGDIVTGTEESRGPYIITTDKASLLVVKVMGKMMEVQVLANPEYRTYIGNVFEVQSKYFVKVGHQTTVDEVAEPVPVEPEKVEQAFKVGDRVVLVDAGDFSPSLSNTEGNTGIILSITVGSTLPVFVKWDNGTTNTYYEHNLELIPEPEKVKEEATYIVSDMAITLMFNGNMQLIDSTHPYFKEVKEAIEAGSFSKAAEMMDIKKAIESFSEGLLKIQSGKVLFRGVEVRNELTSKIVALMSQGNEGFKGFAKFMAKVMDNPSSSTRERLMAFAAAEDIGITTEGLLICYKNVKEDFRPSRAGMWERVDGEWVYDATKYYDNHVGQSPEMPRSEVDDRDEQTCSKGLHVMSLHYAKSFWGTSGHTMVVHVDPVDFVSIPTDYNNSKARVCKYTVASELTKKELDALLAKV